MIGPKDELNFKQGPKSVRPSLDGGRYLSMVTIGAGIETEHPAVGTSFCASEQSCIVCGEDYVYGIQSRLSLVWVC